MASKQHLTDLFKTGKTVEIKARNPVDDSEVIVEVFMRKPSLAQQEKAMATARAKQARRKNELHDSSTDVHKARLLDVEELESRDELLDTLLRTDRSKYRQQAYHEILFEAPEDGSEPKWGKSGTDYLDMEEAIGQRRKELEVLEENPEEDEELKRLLGRRQEFENDVNERYDELVAAKRESYEGNSEEELRDLLFRQFVDMEVGMEWWQEYRMHMVYYATRYPDNRAKLYFDQPSDVMELPSAVSNQFFTYLDEIDTNLSSNQEIGGGLKN